MPYVLSIVLVNVKLVEASCSVAIVGLNVLWSRMKLIITVLCPIVTSLICLFVAVDMQFIGCVGYCHGSAVVASDMQLVI